MAACALLKATKAGVLTARLIGDLWLPLILVSLLASAATVGAQGSPDPRVADLARAGRFRVALYPPQYRKDPATGEIIRNVILMDVAQALAARLGVELRVVQFTTPVEAMDGLKAGDCDMAYLAIDPTRTPEVDYTPPLTESDFTYLVPAGSSIRTAADADRPGIRIAVVRDHGSTLALTRIVKHAALIGANVPDAAFDLLRTGRADVWAAPRVGLLRYVSRLPGSHVLDDRYGAVLFAAAVSKGQSGRLTYISEFIE